MFTLKYCDNDIRKHEKYLSTTLGKMFKDNICGFEVKVLAVCDDLVAFRCHCTLIEIHKRIEISFLILFKCNTVLWCVPPAISSLFEVFGTWGMRQAAQDGAGGHFVLEMLLSDTPGH